MSSLKFGTSGLRGLAAELDGSPAYAYTLAFTTMLAARGALAGDRPDVLLARDLRPSSGAILRRCAAAVHDAGFRPVDCGAVPTPALALAAMAVAAPSIMVTGSHIPADRNGLKFYRPDGEIDKADEAAIVQCHAQLSLGTTSAGGTSSPLPQREVLGAYRQRYIAFFGESLFHGLTIGVYQHSSVARDVVVSVLEALGARVLPFGRSEMFLPVDTEAIRSEDIALAARWARENRVDAIVSTDGDADRPLIADETGAFLRGDIVGALTAAHLGISRIVTPVTSNARLEACGLFAQVLRTRVGSPYVLAGLAEARTTAPGPLLGFEANGGVILASAVHRNGRTLAALPTRDALLPICAVLAEITRQQMPLSGVAIRPGFAAAASTRIAQVPTEHSAAFITRLASEAFRQAFFAPVGGVETCDQTDGLRFMTRRGETIHFRPSGNAPELRIYAEAADSQRAEALLGWARQAAIAHVSG